MTEIENRELKEKLATAQSLLSDVYHFACENGLESVEGQMSCADGCIIDTLNYFEKVTL